MYFSTNLRINSLGQLSFLRLPVLGLLSSRVGRREKMHMTPYPHPLIVFPFFLLTSLWELPPQSECLEKAFQRTPSCILNEHFCFTDININENHACFSCLVTGGSIFTFCSRKVLHTFTFTLFMWDEGTR